MKMKLSNLDLSEKWGAYIGNSIINTSPTASYSTYVGVYGSINPFTVSEINGNTIETSSKVNSSAIRIFDNPALPSATFAHENNISTFGHYGLHYIATDRCDAWLNSIQINPMQGTQPNSGIRLEHSNMAWIGCNIIDGLTNYTPIRGISATFSPSCQIYCNSADHAIRGIELSADCNYTQIYGNTIQDVTDGIVLGAVIGQGAPIPGIIGNQSLPNGVNTPGNVYNGIGGGSFAHASTFSVGSDAGFYDFWANNTGSFWPVINAFIGGGSTTPFNPTNQTSYTPYSCQQECQVLHLSPNLSLSEVENVIQHSSVLSNGNDAIRRRLEYNLYMRIMLQDSNLVDSSTIVSDFIDSLANTTTGKLADISIAIRAIYDSTEVTPNDSIIDSRINSVKAFNSSIEPQTDDEDATKNVNTIILNSIVSRRFILTEDEADSLLVIASQCPYISGPAVYEARALYSLYNCDTIFSDDSLCNDLPIDTCLNSILNKPGSISGPTTGQCGIDSVSYSILPVAGSTGYLWFSGPGAKVNNPANLTSATVNFTDSFQIAEIYVMAINACGSSEFQTITVYASPTNPRTITGNDTVCAGSVETYSTSGSSGAIYYNWSIPSDATILSGDGTSSILLLLGNESGNVSVTASNSCDTSDSESISLIVLSCRLAMNVANKEAIVELFPNPTPDAITIKFEEFGEADIFIEITDIDGRSLFEEKLRSINGTNTHQINVNSLSKGIYFLKLASENRIQVIKFAVQ